MNFRFYGYCMNKVNRDMPYWYWWIMLKLYVLCLEHKIELSIISPEIKNWILNINVNWLVSTDFLIKIHSIENESKYVCCKCWYSWKCRKWVYWVYCWYHYIIIRTKILRQRILLNFK